MNQNKPQAEIALKAKIDEKTAEGHYINIAHILHNQSEFVLDFGRVVPGRKEFTIYSRVMMHPLHAKHLMQALQKNIEKYEKTFGEIKGQLQENGTRRVGF